MRRLVRIALWASLSLALIGGGLLIWLESELRAESLAKRLPKILTSARIKGGVSLAEGSIDGSFKAEGINLTLDDGTKISASAVKGNVGVLKCLSGTYTLESLEIKGLEIDLSGRKADVGPKSVAVGHQSNALPSFLTGPYSISGRIILANGLPVRFTAQGDGFDSSGEVDLRAGLAWPGTTGRPNSTEPRGEVVLSARLSRTLGAHGLTLAGLAGDIGRLKLQVVTKEAGASSNESMRLVIEAKPAAEGISFLGSVRDSAAREALRLRGTLGADGKLKAFADLDTDTSGFGILTEKLPACSVRGTVSATLDPSGWKTDANLRATWPDMSKISPLLAKGSRSEWTIATSVSSAGEEIALERLDVRGHGISLTAASALRWRSGPLPDDSSGAALSLSAKDADMVSLNPFLVATDTVITAGRWSGEATISFTRSRPEITGGRTHAIRGLSVSTAGKPIFKDLDASFPLITKDGAILLSSFETGFAGGRIAGGTASFTPGEGGAWKAGADLDIDLASLRKMPGWEGLPADRMTGLRAALKADAERTVGRLPTVTSMHAGISKNGVSLLTMRLRQPLMLGGERPAGTLIDISAGSLPLESVSALVPGLGLSGDVRKADLALGFKKEGLFIRTEGSPVILTETSVSWKGNVWADRCDLTAGIEILLGEGTSSVGLSKAELRNRGRLLAGGNIVIGLDGAPTLLDLSGSLGALGEQPFASMVSSVTAGTYEARAELTTEGKMTVKAKAADLMLRESPVRISSAAIQANFEPSASGLDAEGDFQLVALGRSEGKFKLSQRKQGLNADWRADVDVPSVVIDDFMALLPKSREPSGPSVSPTPKSPDRAPFWTGNTGTAAIKIGKVVVLGLEARSIEAELAADATSANLIRLSGRLAEGSISGKGSLLFQPKTSGGPYVLDGQVGVSQADLGTLGGAFPATANCIEGKGDARVKVTATAGTAPELPMRAVIEVEATSKDGRLRTFGDGKSKTAGIISGAGELSEALGAVAILGGALGKNEKIMKAGAAISAAAKLQKAVSDFRYDTVEIRAERLASGTLKLTKLEARNKELRVSASGAIAMNPTLPFADRPLLIDAQLSGRGELADYFQILGFVQGPPSPDGLTTGPGIKISGSLNDIRNDLRERIEAAVSRKGPEAPATAPQQNPPAVNQGPERRRNPLDDLLKEIGR